VFEGIAMTEGTFTHRGFTRLKQLEYLIRTQQVDGDLFWRPLGGARLPTVTRVPEASR
jgi:hypothetical protein